MIKSETCVNFQPLTFTYDSLNHIAYLSNSVYDWFLKLGLLRYNNRSIGLLFQGCATQVVLWKNILLKSQEWVAYMMTNGIVCKHVLLASYCCTPCYEGVKHWINASCVHLGVDNGALNCAWRCCLAWRYRTNCLQAAPSRWRWSISPWKPSTWETFSPDDRLTLARHMAQVSTNDLCPAHTHTYPNTQTYTFLKKRYNNKEFSRKFSPKRHVVFQLIT